jgi:hypothetical protein
MSGASWGAYGARLGSGARRPQALLWWPTVTTLTSLHSGHDVAYFLREREAGGCVGAMSSEAAQSQRCGSFVL